MSELGGGRRINACYLRNLKTAGYYVVAKFRFGHVVHRHDAGNTEPGPFYRKIMSSPAIYLAIPEGTRLSRPLSLIVVELWAFPVGIVRFQQFKFVTFCHKHHVGQRLPPQPRNQLEIRSDRHLQKDPEILPVALRFPCRSCVTELPFLAGDVCVCGRTFIQNFPSAAKAAHKSA